MNKIRTYLYEKLIKIANKIRPASSYKIEGIDDMFFGCKPAIKDGNYYIKSTDDKSDIYFPFTESQLAILGYLFSKYVGRRP